MKMVTDASTIDNVRNYYGQTLSGSHDLQTNACCLAEDVPASHKAILSEIEEEILMRFYGCGSPIPEAVEGCTVLDLGCGTGRDVYLMSKLVGEKGYVIGVDMTSEQIEVARRHRESQCARFGFAKPNVDFRQGIIEDLVALDIADDSVDVVISNCVINLSSNKERVFSEIYRVLKPGGELYFSDVYADRRIPCCLRKDPVFHGECLGGALYREDFRRLLADVGFPDFRIVKAAPVTIDNPAMAAKAGNLTFDSLTVRTFKLDNLEDRCEDYGQAAIYNGTIPEHPHGWTLDDHHLFETGRAVSVCGNTAAMLQETRFAPHFTIVGDRSKHFGLFDCGSPEGGQAPICEMTDAVRESGGCC
jgi:SAM-dependent methyltransferase